jgi:hypothetical protein
MRRASSVFSIACGLLAGCGTTTFPQDVDVDAGDGDAASGATATLGAACASNGALACAGHAQKLQLVCDGEKWVANGTCPGQQLCDPRPGPTQGSCQDPAPGCGDKTPGSSFCDGATRHRCDSDLLAATSTACRSAALCLAGTDDRCAACLDGETACEGPSLKSCAPDHQSFVAKETCGSSALCVPGEAKCRSAACDAGAYQCAGDTLQQCSDGRTSWTDVKRCGPGLCDATAKACRDCTPGSKSCAGSTPQTCDAVGHWVDGTACAGTTPVCTAGACGVGVCSTGDHRCTGDMLEMCNALSTGWTTVATCGAGLCDAIEKACDACKPGQLGCSGASPQTCDVTGHWSVAAPCAGTTPSCVAGECVAPSGCAGKAPSVLFYGPAGAKEAAYLPAGSTTTIATEATWRAMSIADFSKYDLIVIGEAFSVVSPTAYQAAFDTQTTWASAGRGNIVVSTMLAVWADVKGGNAAAATYLKAALAWTAHGPATGIFIGSDYGYRSFDYVASIGGGGWAWGGGGGSSVDVLLPGHPTMAGSTSASLSGWTAASSSSYDNGSLTEPLGFQVVAAAKPTAGVPTPHVVVVHQEPCP